METKIGATNPVYRTVLYDGLGQVIAWHNRTTYTNLFLPLGGQTFATYEASQTFFLHSNHLGSTTFVTDHAGTVTQKSVFYPFGQLAAMSGTMRDERFASLERRDAETSLDPTLFRMYHSRLYRWLSPDPVAGSISNPQSLNRYAYVLNNPCNYVDPLGLECTIGITNIGQLLSQDQLRAAEGEILNLFWSHDIDVRIGTGNVDFSLNVIAEPYPAMGVSGTTVGYTGTEYEGGPIANFGFVFANRAAESARESRGSIRTGVAVGRAGAHEFGHWALNSKNHVPRTFMQESFSGRQWYSHDPKTMTNLWRLSPPQWAAIGERCGFRGEAQQAGAHSLSGGPSGVPTGGRRGGGGSAGAGVLVPVYVLDESGNYYVVSGYTLQPYSPPPGPRRR